MSINKLIKSKLIILFGIHTCLALIFLITDIILYVYGLKFRWYISSIYTIFIVLGYFIYLLIFYFRISEKINRLTSLIIGIILTIGIPIYLIYLGAPRILFKAPEKIITMDKTTYVCEIYDSELFKLYCYSYQNNNITQGRVPILSIDYGKIDYDPLSSITQPQHSSAIYTYYDSNGKIMYSVEK